MARHTVSYSSHFKVFTPKPIWHVILYPTLVISRFLHPNLYGTSYCILLKSFQGFYTQTYVVRHTVSFSSHFKVFTPKPIVTSYCILLKSFQGFYTQTYMARHTVSYSSHFKGFTPKPIWYVILYPFLVTSKFLDPNLYGTSYCILL